MAVVSFLKARIDNRPACLVDPASRPKSEASQAAFWPHQGFRNVGSVKLSRRHGCDCIAYSDVLVL